MSIEDKLAKLDNPQPAEPYPGRDHLVRLLESFQASLGELGHVLIEPVKNPEWTWEPAIRRAIAAARDGACVLEQIDEATTYYERPPPQPRGGTTVAPTGSRSSRSIPRDVPNGWGSVLITSALGIGGALWWRKRKKQQRGG